MKPETINRTSFYTNLNQRRTISIGNVLQELPFAIPSFLGEVITYKKMYKATSEDIKPFIDTWPAKLLSFWAYTTVSGRHLSKVHGEGFLIPAALLYSTCVTQDDILDDLKRREGNITAHTAFWERSSSLPLHDPRSMFRKVIEMIEENPMLNKNQRIYIKGKIALAYRSYTFAEDQIIYEAQNNNIDLYEIHLLRAKSFGLMAKAITAVLNGKECESLRSTKIEDTMAWFIMAGEILDSEIDREEDRGYTMSLPLAGDLIDRNLNQEQGITVEQLLYLYLSKVDNNRITSFLLALRYLYPKLEKALRRIELLKKGSFTRLTLK